MKVKEDTALVAEFKAESTDFDADFVHKFSFKLDDGSTSVQNAYAVKVGTEYKVVATKPADDEYYGTFAIDESTGKYTFTINSDAKCVKELNNQHSLTFTTTVIVDDSMGGTDTKPITVNLEGTNNAPVLTLPSSGKVEFTEDDAIPTIQASATDYEDNASGGQAGYPKFSFLGEDNKTTMTSVTVSNIGTFTINEATGEIVLDKGSNDYQHLGAYDAANPDTYLTTTIRVQVADFNKATDVKDLTVLIKGVDDAPLNSPPDTLPDAPSDTLPDTPPALVPDLLGDETDNLLVWTGATTCNGKGGTDLLAVGGDLFTDQDSLFALANSPTVTDIELFLGSKVVTSLTSLGDWAVANKVTFDGAGGITPDASVWTKGASAEAGFDLYTASGTTDSTDDDMLLLVKQAAVING